MSHRDLEMAGDALALGLSDPRGWSGSTYRLDANRKTILAAATFAAIGAAALIPTQASAGGGGKGGGGMGGGHHGHGYWGAGFGGVVLIGPSCWRWIPGVGRVYVCY
jgi:hypothetical protein